MNRLIKSEYLAAAILTALIYIYAGFAWYWLVLLFLLFDISMIGYFISNKVGAIIYNTVHSFFIPAALLVIYVFTNENILLFVALLWLFHIFVDRTFGYGLKYPKGFRYTHLGTIGRVKSKLYK